MQGRWRKKPRRFHGGGDPGRGLTRLPFASQVCGKSFNRMYNLLGHMHLHAGSKPFKCPYCTSKFNLKGNLSRHMKVKHGIMDTSADGQGGVLLFVTVHSVLLRQCDQRGQLSPASLGLWCTLGSACFLISQPSVLMRLCRSFPTCLVNIAASGLDMPVSISRDWYWGREGCGRGEGWAQFTACSL